RSGLGAGLERDGQTWAQGQARRRSRVACPVRNGLLPRPRGFVVCAGSQIGPSDHHPWPVCVGTYSEARPGPVTAWESVDSTDIRAGLRPGVRRGTPTEPRRPANTVGIGAAASGSEGFGVGNA